MNSKITIWIKTIYQQSLSTFISLYHLCASQRFPFWKSSGCSRRKRLAHDSFLSSPVVEEDKVCFHMSVNVLTYCNLLLSGNDFHLLIWLALIHCSAEYGMSFDPWKFSSEAVCWFQLAVYCLTWWVVWRVFPFRDGEGLLCCLSISPHDSLLLTVCWLPRSTNLPFPTLNYWTGIVPFIK